MAFRLADILKEASRPKTEDLQAPATPLLPSTQRRSLFPRELLIPRIQAVTQKALATSPVVQMVEVTDDGPLTMDHRPEEIAPPPRSGFRFLKIDELKSSQRVEIPLQEERPRPPNELSHEPSHYVAQAIRRSETNREQTARDVYNQAITLADYLLERAKTGAEMNGGEVQTTIEEIIRELTYESNELLNLALSQTVDEKGANFLATKIVNKTILALEIGGGKKMNKSKLFQLGMGAFFSDFGIVKVLDIITKKEVLKTEELLAIREIPYRTVEILKKVSDLSGYVLNVAKESHERLDGSGPLGIKEIQQMDEFSRIVAVIDVFEALTHDRPHRPRLLPHEAMRKILEEGGKYEEGVLRMLIDRIGLYPIGSWVKMTNKEVAKVIGSNPGLPLRPRIKIVFDEWGKQLETPPAVDLSKQLSLHILQPVSDEDLKKLMKVH